MRNAYGILRAVLRNFGARAKKILEAPIEKH
jgi:hypothetical protein